MLIGIFDPLGAQFDRLRCEVCQNLISSPMNTGFLRPAVATVLTVYGIETQWFWVTMQKWNDVATVLTVYGIETFIDIIEQRFNIVCCNSTYRLRYWNFNTNRNFIAWICDALQQYLPFTVLKLSDIIETYLNFFSCNSTYRLRYWN